MANLNLTVPDAAVPRIRAALRDRLGLDHLPTTTEIQDYLRSHLRDVVVQAERNRLIGDAATTAEANVATDFPA